MKIASQSQSLRLTSARKTSSGTPLCTSTSSAPIFSMAMAARPPHVVLVAFPAQGHVTPLMQLARLLHSRGAHVTFVHTQSNYSRIAGAKGSSSSAGAAGDPRFRVEVIDDGISASVPAMDPVPLITSIERTCPGSFRALLRRLGSERATPPVTCVVYDVVMTFAPAVAREAGVPEAAFFTASACGFLCFLHYQELIDRGIVPFKDSSCLTNGYLDTPLEWVPGMKHLRLKDMPTFCRTTAPDDFMVAIHLEHVKVAAGSSAVIVNTLYELEKDSLEAISAGNAAYSLPPVYAVGPLAEVVASSSAPAMDIAVWTEDRGCLTWLDGKAAGSVVYVNFGSIAIMTPAQTREFALGMLRCGFPFLWVKRPDVVDGEELPLPGQFMDEVARGGGMVVSWCPQAEVLKHAAVGLFVTHCGWNSMLEATAAGQPVLGWPIIAEQTTNCRQACECWGNGAALPEQVQSGAVADLVREMMSGDTGKEKRAKAREWMAVAEAAIQKGGSTWRNIERMMDDVLLRVGNK